MDINSINWFHQIELGNGVVTPGIDKTREKIGHLHFPDMTGKTVLDIGSWNGAMCFEAERLGAKRVLATDHYCWGGDGQGRLGFEWAREALKSKVEDKHIKVEDISPETVGTFDIVLFLGVLYHAPDPLGYLAKVRSVCKEMAIIETLVDGLDIPKPALIFYEGATMNNDPSNFFGPNQLACEAMIREVGFSRVEKVSDFFGNRMAFHAYV